MIYEKLSKIQNSLFVPKGQKNNFGNYNYRSCEDILKTVKPLCEDNKCVLTISNKTIEVGGRVYTEAEVRLVDLEDNSEIKATAQAREEESKKGMDGSQISGASSSYARKYALAGLFCIDNEKDSDATNDHGASERVSKVPLSDAHIASLKTRCVRDGVPEELICSLYKVESLDKLTPKYLTNINEHWPDIVAKAKESE